MVISHAIVGAEELDTVSICQRDSILKLSCQTKQFEIYVKKEYISFENIIYTFSKDWWFQNL